MTLLPRKALLAELLDPSPDNVLGVGRDPMSLSLFAAETLVLDYLNGRVVPCALHRAAVLAAETRLVNGLLPVLDETLCSKIEEGATAPPT